jgi:hypothetical protein
MAGLTALAAAVSAPAAAATHYLDVVNNGQDTLERLDASPTGRGEWRTLDVGTRNAPTLPPNSDAVVAFAVDEPSSCVVDLRPTVRGKGTFLVVRFNICKNATFHIRGAVDAAERQAKKAR